VNGISVVIANYNNPDLVRSCIRSIDLHLDVSKLEVIVVDNGSRHQELSVLAAEYPFVRYHLLDKNFGFGFAINFGVERSTFPNTVIMNSDIQIVDETFQELVTAFDLTPGGQIWSPEIVGDCGEVQPVSLPKLSAQNFLRQFSVINDLSRLSNLRNRLSVVNRLDQELNVDILYGACLIIKKSDFRLLNGFDENYFMYFEDIDLCDRFRDNLSGTLSVHTESQVMHKSRGSSESRTGINRIFLKSKYRYAFRRYGFVFSLLFVLFDFPLQIVLANAIVISQKMKYFSKMSQ
jgi:GT2 family glycosyltransferase